MTEEDIRDLMDKIGVRSYITYARDKTVVIMTYDEFRRAWRTLYKKAYNNEVVFIHKEWTIALYRAGGGRVEQ